MIAHHFSFVYFNLQLFSLQLCSSKHVRLLQAKNIKTILKISGTQWRIQQNHPPLLQYWHLARYCVRTKYRTKDLPKKLDDQNTSSHRSLNKQQEIAGSEIYVAGKSYCSIIVQNLNLSRFACAKTRTI
jgi:hypothetical protein